MKFANGTRNICGLVAPLSALKSDSGGPCGEFPDLVPLGKIARAWGFGLVQLLPVNDTGSQTSPYSALSAFALHPLYIRIRDLPEAKEPSAAAKAALRAAADIDSEAGEGNGVAFEAIYARKIEALKALWNAAASASAAVELDAWCKTRLWVKPYACFVELKRRNGGKAWWEWADHRNPEPGFAEFFWTDRDSASDCRFWAWLQMRAEGQFAEASRALADMAIDLMGDIPILMNADSADVWYRRGLFRTDRSAGAPPDMYSPSGQNWGFPLYDWDAHAAEGYSFWKERLVYADRFYSAYRIDHVLGFFRIWSLSNREEDGFMGSFVPEIPISWPDLAALGLSPERIRWLSRPHVPQAKIASALSESGLPVELDDPGSPASALFVRIDNEPLFLFRDEIGGGKDIGLVLKAWEKNSAGSPVSPGAVGRFADKARLFWRDRTLYEFAGGRFAPSWYFRDTTAWASLSGHEKSVLEALISLRRGESLSLWERSGRKILKELTEAVPMQACAEDLGAVPPCVPKVLSELKIPGLRVLRWHREYDRAGAPYIPFPEYPEDSVACPSVHDSTSLRQWWVEEADREALWAMAVTAAAADPGGWSDRNAPDMSSLGGGADLPRFAPAELGPESVVFILEAMATARSKILALPIQDLLAMSPALREPDAKDERINIPGTTGGANWRYRVRPTLEEIAADGALAERARRVSSKRNDRRD